MGKLSSTVSGLSSAARSIRNDPYRAIGYLELFDRVANFTKGIIPGFQHGIQVVVTGGPQSNIRRIWYLAVSACFGRLRNRVLTALTPMTMEAVWDISNKAVSIEVVYCTNALMAVERAIDPGLNLGPNTLNDPQSCAVAMLLRGPEQLTVGGRWSSAFDPPPASMTLGTGFGSAPFLLPGLQPEWIARITTTVCPQHEEGEQVTIFPLGVVDREVKVPINILHELPDGNAIQRSAHVLNVAFYPFRVVTAHNATKHGMTALVLSSNRYPSLPDQGRVITTAEKLDVRVQPPKPPYDGSSRTGLLALVAQAIQQPCYLPTSPPCTTNTAAQPGVFINFTPFAGDAYPTTLAALWSNKTKQGLLASWPLDPEQGPDGYPKAPTSMGKVLDYGN